MERLPRRRLNPHLGVEIECSSLGLGDGSALTPEGVESLFRSVLEHKVVILRNTGLEARPGTGLAQLGRQLQTCSLAGLPGVERPDKLLFEDGITVNERRKHPDAPGVINIGPWPTKRGGNIGNAFWHHDWEHYPTPGWFTLLRMSRIPRDPKTGEVLPCGDTLWCDMTIAWEDLPEAEKEFFGPLRCVYDWRVGFPDLIGKPFEAELDAQFPTCERPFVRPHPVTGRLALTGDPLYVSHIVGMTKEQTDEVFDRMQRLCEVPEYQLRVPWHSEGDVTIHDNSVVMHRVVADFYDIPPESRALENCGTKGVPCPEIHRVLRPGEVTVDLPHQTKSNSVGLTRWERDHRLRTSSTSRL